MSEGLAHLFGDYVVQSHYMASEKRRSPAAAAAHAEQEAWSAQHERWRRSWRGRWVRLRMWAYAHRPVLHLGECKRCSMCDDD